MGDYSDNYTDNKKGRIFISNGEKKVNFKPFIDSFSFTFSNDTTTNSSEKIFNKTLKAEKFKESKYSTSFNILAANVNEAISNHNKFQILMRMIAPSLGTSFSEPKKIYVKFSNLISNSGQIGKINMSETQILQEGFRGIINDLKYQPDMEMGFFEFNGMLFAKAFKIDLVVTAIPFQNASTSPSFVSGYNYGREDKIKYFNTTTSGNNTNIDPNLETVVKTDWNIPSALQAVKEFFTGNQPKKQNEDQKPKIKPLNLLPTPEEVISGDEGFNTTPTVKP